VAQHRVVELEARLNFSQGFLGALAYQIQKLAKAHYVCLNVECTKETLAEIETGFKFNDAVLRHLTVSKAKAETTPSVMMKAVEKEESRKSAHQQEAAA